MKNPRKKIVLLFIFILVFLLLSTTYYFLFTVSGGSFILKRLSKVVFKQNEIAWKEEKGSLIRGMEYKNVVLEDLKYFPIPNKLTMESVYIDINSFALSGVVLKVTNAKLILPGSVSIMFYGDFQDETLDFNFYVKEISDKEIKSLVNASFMNGVSSEITDLDFFVKGKLKEPLLNGEFIIKKLMKNSFLLENSPSNFDISIKNINDIAELYGTIIFKEGILKGKKTALVKLKESKIIFKGDPKTPEFDIKAESLVEKIKMFISLKGTFKEPDLKVTSIPPMARERLLLVLLTNRTWGGKTFLVKAKASLLILQEIL